MCGRFTQRLSSAEFARIFSARDLADAAGERYNVAPTQQVLAVVERAEERVLDRFRWGLVPHWATTTATGSRMFNARAETIASSPAFRHSFRARRCLIPADGFYEWQRSPAGRQPFYITSVDGPPLAFAGLWSARHNPATDLTLRSCTIVTTTPNELMAPIHNRMPVILPPKQWGLWLDRDTDLGELQTLLRPAACELVAHPVAPLVNSVRNQGAALILPPAPSMTHGTGGNRVMARRRSLVSPLYRTARLTNNVSALVSGNPHRIARRAKNKVLGGTLARGGLWRLLWGGRRGS